MTTRARLTTHLLRPQEAADLLRVHVRTVQKWIEKDAIPYVQLPQVGTKPTYRIPLQGLLNSLSGTWDLEGELDLTGDFEALVRGSAESKLSEDEVSEALAEEPAAKSRR